MTVFIGVAAGALAIVDTADGREEVLSLPRLDNGGVDWRSLNALLSKFTLAGAICVIEKPVFQPGDDPVAAVAAGTAYGSATTALSALRIDVRPVSRLRWRSSLGVAADADDASLAKLAGRPRSVTKFLQSRPNHSIAVLLCKYTKAEAARAAAAQARIGGKRKTEPAQVPA